MTINQPLFQLVLDQIRMEPESHHQGSWEFTNSCGTTRCVAGWAIHIATGLGVVEACNEYRRMQDHPQNVAAMLLGLTDLERDDLFYDMDRDNVLRKVEMYAMKGRDWK